MPRVGKFIETESRLVVVRGQGEGGKLGVTANKYRDSLWDDGCVLESDVCVCVCVCVHACLVAQSCLTLGEPMDCSQPGSLVHGIFQARILE